MVIFEGQAFDEKKVSTIIFAEDNSWSASVKDRYNIIMTLTDGNRLFWKRLFPETAITKIKQIVQLINDREDEILKLRYKAD